MNDSSSPVAAAPMQGRAWRYALYAALVAATIAVSLFAHVRAGLSLPVPWEDESAFLWQAVSVAEHNTLLAPQINPQRPLMWMPPGYAVAMGLLFKLVPFSLPAARAVSWLLGVAVFLAMLWLFRKQRPIVLVLLSTALFYLGAPFVVMGNTARMEALLLLLVVSAMIALDADRPYISLAILMLCPLVHPNGLIFLGLGLLIGAWAWRHKPPLGRTDRVLLAVSLLFLILYGIYVIANWQAFNTDIAYQLQLKAGRGLLSSLLHSTDMQALVLLFSLIGGGHVLLLRRATPVLLLGAFSLLVPLVADELWYGVFASVAFATLTPLALDIVGELARRRPVFGQNATRVASLIAVIVLLGLAWANGFIEGPRSYPGNMRWGGGMRVSDGVPYLIAEDKAAVMAAITHQLAGASRRTVEFYPSADGLLFWPEKGRDFMPWQPLFSSDPSCVVAMHVSHYFPRWWDGEIQQVMQSWQLTDSDIVQSRDRAETWYVKRLPSCTTGG